MNQDAHDNHIERHEDEMPQRPYNQTDAQLEIEGKQALDYLRGRKLDFGIVEDTSHIQEVPQPLTELHDTIAKLEADLAAAKQIIIDAGKQVEVLKAQDAKHAAMALRAHDENVRLRKAIEGVTGAMSTAIAAQYVGYPEAKAWRILLNQALQNVTEITVTPDAVTSEAPKFVCYQSKEVTLTDSEVNWLALHNQGTTFVYQAGSLPDSLYYKTKPSEALRNRGNGKQCYTMLDGRHNCKANWDAIEAKRKELS